VPLTVLRFTQDKQIIHTPVLTCIRCKTILDREENNNVQPQLVEIIEKVLVPLETIKVKSQKLN